LAYCRHDQLSQTRDHGTETTLRGAVLDLLDHLADEDVASVKVACTHGLFTDGALERIQGRLEVEEIVCTNTVPVPN
jgi:phosphoribosylpyrophosphate synthetase